jgi:hypothetical protein
MYVHTLEINLKCKKWHFQTKYKNKSGGAQSTLISICEQDNLAILRALLSLPRGKPINQCRQGNNLSNVSIDWPPPSWTAEKGKDRFVTAFMYSLISIYYFKTGLLYIFQGESCHATPHSMWKILWLFFVFSFSHQIVLFYISRQLSLFTSLPRSRLLSHSLKFSDPTHWYKCCCTAHQKLVWLDFQTVNIKRLMHDPFPLIPYTSCSSCCSLWETLPCDWEVRGHCMCEEMPVILVDKVVDPKRTIRKVECWGGGEALGVADTPPPQKKTYIVSCHVI